jgi:glycosyltransferase involved in cell wall biosynthesis
MPSPSVSILILNYRLREQVRDCLRSLQSLNYPNFRVIVIDNDSGDGIEAMVER